MATPEGHRSFGSGHGRAGARSRHWPNFLLAYDSNKLHLSWAFVLGLFVSFRWEWRWRLYVPRQDGDSAHRGICTITSLGHACAMDATELRKPEEMCMDAPPRFARTHEAGALWTTHWLRRCGPTTGAPIEHAPAEQRRRHVALLMKKGGPRLRMQPLLSESLVGVTP